MIRVTNELNREGETNRKGRNDCSEKTSARKACCKKGGKKSTGLYQKSKKTDNVTGNKCRKGRKRETKRVEKKGLQEKNSTSFLTASRVNPQE